MSNMQLNDGPHGAWAGACRTSSDAIADYNILVPSRSTYSHDRARVGGAAGHEIETIGS